MATQGSGHNSSSNDSRPSPVLLPDVNQTLPSISQMRKLRLGEQSRLPRSMRQSPDPRHRPDCRLTWLLSFPGGPGPPVGHLHCPACWGPRGQPRPASELRGISCGHLRGSPVSPWARAGLEWAVGAGPGGSTVSPGVWGGIFGEGGVGRGGRPVQRPNQALSSLFLEAQTAPQW